MSARPKPARLAAVVVGVIVLLFVALLATREPAAERKADSNLIGKQAPGLGGAVLLGKPFDIGASDRWLVVNFFASWCGPCIEEHPELVAFAAEHAVTGDARVVSVVYSDDEDDVRDFFNKRGGDWTVFDSDEGRTALDWGVPRVPESYLVAPTGVVVRRFVSGVTQDQLNAVIDQYDALAEQQQSAPSTEEIQP